MPESVAEVEVKLNFGTFPQESFLLQGRCEGGADGLTLTVSAFLDSNRAIAPCRQYLSVDFGAGKKEQSALVDLTAGGTSIWIPGTFCSARIFNERVDRGADIPSGSLIVRASIIPGKAGGGTSPRRSVIVAAPTAGNEVTLAVPRFAYQYVLFYSGAIAAGRTPFLVEQRTFSATANVLARDNWNLLTAGPGVVANLVAGVDRLRIFNTNIVPPPDARIGAIFLLSL